MSQVKVRILIPFNEGQKKGDIRLMSEKSAKKTVQEGYAEYVGKEKETLSKTPTSSSCPSSFPSSSPSSSSSNVLSLEDLEKKLIDLKSKNNLIHHTDKDRVEEKQQIKLEIYELEKTITETKKEAKEKEKLEKKQQEAQFKKQLLEDVKNNLNGLFFKFNSVFEVYFLMSEMKPT